MSTLEEKTYSFIVKIWFEEDENFNLAPQWRGRVTQIPSYNKAYFNKYDGMVQIIDQFIKSTDFHADESNE